MNLFNKIFIKRHRLAVLEYLKEKLTYNSARDLCEEIEEDEEILDQTSDSQAESFSKEDETQHKTQQTEAPIKSPSTKAEGRPDILYSSREKEIRHHSRSRPTVPAGRTNVEYDQYNLSEVSREIAKRLKDGMPWKTLGEVGGLRSATKLTFVQKLKQYIKERDLKETDVYKAALMDRRLFSKMICNDGYQPSKDTAFALIFALKLSAFEAEDLLSRAGYAFSHSIQRDIIIEYFIIQGKYNLNNVNAFLYSMNEKIIGRGI